MGYQSKQSYVDELLPILLLSSASLVLEHDIIVPPSLHVEILRVKKRVSSSNINLSFLLFLSRSFLFLQKKKKKKM